MKLEIGMRISSLQCSSQYLQTFWNVPVAMASKPSCLFWNCGGCICCL